MIGNRWELMAFMKRERLVTVQGRWACSSWTGVPWGVIASFSLPFVWGICEGILYGRDAEMKDEIATVVSGDLCQGRKALIWATVLVEQSGHYEWASPPAPSAPAPPPKGGVAVAGKKIRRHVTQHFSFLLFSPPTLLISWELSSEKESKRKNGLPFHRGVQLQGEGICQTMGREGVRISWNLSQLSLQLFSYPRRKPRSYLMVAGITECWVDYSRLISCSSRCQVTA